MVGRSLLMARTTRVSLFTRRFFDKTVTDGYTPKSRSNPTRGYRCSPSHGLYEAVLVPLCVTFLSAAYFDERNMNNGRIHVVPFLFSNVQIGKKKFKKWIVKLKQFKYHDSYFIFNSINIYLIFVLCSVLWY